MSSEQSKGQLSLSDSQIDIMASVSLWGKVLAVVLVLYGGIFLVLSSLSVIGLYHIILGPFIYRVSSQLDLTIDNEESEVEHIMDSLAHIDAFFRFRLAMILFAVILFVLFFVYSLYIVSVGG